MGQDAIFAGTPSAAFRLSRRHFPGLETDMSKTIGLLAVAGALMGLAACNTTTEQKAAVGAVGGAVVAGPVGAAVGGAAGAVAGKATEDEKKH